MPTKTITVVDDEGCDVEHKVPVVWVICGVCSGEGKSSAHLGAFSGDEMDADPDFRDDYMSGVYDRQCDECKGSGKELEVDWDTVDPAVRTALEAHFQFLADCRAEDEAERRMGC